MMAEKETSRYASGYRFNPFDQELINDYLKPLIMGKQLPCNIISCRQVYGPSSNPWLVFDPNDHHSWLVSPDSKPTEKFMFVFARLSKISRTATSSKNYSKRAGCGTWVGKTKRDQIRDGEGNVIGEKRYLVFEIKEIDSEAAGVGFDFSNVGFYKMHEYSLSGVNQGLNSGDGIVLCKITYDSSKNCPITVKPGTKIADHVLTSSSVLKITCDSSEECLITIKSGNQILDHVSTSSEAQEEEANNNKNLEGMVSVTTENPTLIDGGVGEWNDAAQYNNGVRKGHEFSGDICFNDLAGGECPCFDDVAGGECACFKHLAGGEYPCFDDQGGEGHYFDNLCGDGLCFDIDLWEGCLDFNQQEELVEEDRSISKLGKRKLEAEENSYSTKKMCL